MLRVQVIGPLRAFGREGAIPLPDSARARALLAWLALSPGPHPRSILAPLLRPDVLDDSARKSLRQAVFDLRHAHPAFEAATRSGRDSIELLPDVGVDRREFDRRVVSGDREGADALVQGILLADVDEEWVFAERERFAQAVRENLRSLADSADREGRLEDALVWTRRVVEACPLSETDHMALIDRLSRSGDRGAALEAFDAMAATLREELDIEPSAPAKELARRLRAQDPLRPDVLRAATPPLPVALVRSASFVGRDRELKQLTRVLADATAGTMRFAVLRGEPGIGKTRLAGEFASRAHAAGASVLFGRCDHEGGVPLQPVIDAFRQAIDSLDEPDRAALFNHGGAALSAVLSTDLIDSPPARGSDDDAERYRRFEGLRAALGVLGGAGAVVLVIDDLHWADRATLHFLRHLGRTARAERLMVVATQRDTEPETDALALTLGGLRRDHPVALLKLHGLSETEIEAMVGALGTGRVEELHRRSGGNPFFVEQLARRGDEPTDSPPDQIAEVVAERLDRVDPATRDLLGYAALMGLEFWLRDLDALGLMGRDALVDTLDEALERGFIQEREDGRYSFAHALIAEGVGADLSGARRGSMHLRIGECLAAAGRPAGVVARHLHDAGDFADPLEAAAWLCRAGDEAARLLAFEDALTAYTQALARYPHDADPARRAHILLRLADAADRAGQDQRARDGFAEAFDIGERESDASLMARAALGFGGLSLVITDPDPETVRMLERARDRLPEDAVSERSRVSARLATEVFYADPDAADALSDTALRLAEYSGADSDTAFALAARRVAVWGPERLEERLRISERAIAVAERSGDREGALRGRTWQLVDLAELGRLDRVLDEIERYDAESDAVGLPHYRWYAPLWKGMVALLHGRFDEASAFRAEAERIGGLARDRNVEVHVLIQDLMGLIDQGRWHELGEERVRGLAERGPIWKPWCALMLTHLGYAQDARTMWRDYRADGMPGMGEGPNWHIGIDVAQLLTAIKDEEAARETYGRMAPFANLYPVVARGAYCCGSAEHYLGMLAATAGMKDLAVRHLESAIEKNTVIGAAVRLRESRQLLDELG